jgi:hypothetical protein
VCPAGVSAGTSITATATDPGNDPSEFSACVAAASGTPASTPTAAWSLNPSHASQSLTFTATAPITGGGPTPTGSASFSDGATLLGTGTLDGSGMASMTTLSPSVGNHRITAQYGVSWGRQRKEIPIIYKPAATLRQTTVEVDRTIADDIILVDDASNDDVTAMARGVGLYDLVHPANLGYSGNQKAWYSEALARGRHIVVILPRDYQFSPRLLPPIAAMLPSGHPWTRDLQPMIPTVAAELLPEVRRP